MKKSLALFIVAILVLPMLTFIAPVSASTGHPAIGTYNGSLQIAVTSVNVTAGGIVVEAVDGATPSVYPGNLTIIFTINSTLLVDFSGAQFDLYMSKNGYSNLTSDDVLYASGFMVSDLNLPFGGQTYEITNARLLNGEGTFDLGWINESGTVYKILTGPIPFDITNDYKYIKIFDGSATLIAAAGIINILPAISITPTWGPACAEITMTGVALNANTLYNVTYDADEDGEGFIGQVWSDANGKFTYVFNAPDLKEEHNHDWGERIRFYVADATTGASMGMARFIELTREIWNIYIGCDPTSYISDEYGNGTGYWGTTYVGGETECLNAKVFDTLWIEGDHWCPTSPIVIAIDGIVLGTFNANASGYFNATGMVIPELGNGNHNLTITNNGVFYQYCINVIPTLIVTPDSGTCGTTVTFTAFGFPANTAVYLYWEYDCQCPEDEVWIINATVGADGKFNMTVSWVIPNTYGGIHEIDAFTTYGSTTHPGGGWITNTHFCVTPSIWIEVPGSELAEFASDNGGIFYLMGCGLDPYFLYSVNIDNQAFAAPTAFPMTSPTNYILSDCCGALSLELVMSGFRPGLHTVALYYWDPTFGCINCEDEKPSNPCDSELICNLGSSFGDYKIAAYATFTVTTEGDPIADQLAAIDAMIVSIDGSIATIQTTLGELQMCCEDLNAQITALNGEMVTIQTDIGAITTTLSTINGKVTSIEGDVATIETSLGTISGTVTAMDGDVATIKTDLGTVKTNVASIRGFLPVDMTPIWIAVILSLVAAVAAIYAVVVIRGKIAA